MKRLIGDSGDPERRKSATHTCEEIFDLILSNLVSEWACTGERGPFVILGSSETLWKVLWKPQTSSTTEKTSCGSRHNLNYLSPLVRSAWYWLKTYCIYTWVEQRLCKHTFTNLLKLSLKARACHPESFYDIFGVGCDIWSCFACGIFLFETGHMFRPLI